MSFIFKAVLRLNNEDGMTKFAKKTRQIVSEIISEYFLGKYKTVLEITASVQLQAGVFLLPHAIQGAPKSSPLQFFAVFSATV